MCRVSIVYSIVMKTSSAEVWPPARYSRQNPNQNRNQTRVGHQLWTPRHRNFGKTIRSNWFFRLQSTGRFAAASGSNFDCSRAKTDCCRRLFVVLGSRDPWRRQFDPMLLSLKKILKCITMSSGFLTRKRNEQNLRLALLENRFVSSAEIRLQHHYSYYSIRKEHYISTFLLVKQPNLLDLTCRFELTEIQNQIQHSYCSINRYELRLNNVHSDRCRLPSPTTIKY